MSNDTLEMPLTTNILSGRKKICYSRNFIIAIVMPRAYSV